MQAKRLTLAAGAETAFEFDHYASNSVVVKNETAGEILFCDGPFDAAKAAHIPAFSWQALNVRVFPGEKPKFYVKAAAQGTVEIDFGSSGAGVLINELTSDVELAEGTDVQAYLLKGISTAEGSKTTLIDGSKNLAANLLAGKSIKFTVGGVEYLRKIVSNTENTITFGELVAAAPATAAIEKTAGGKVTITAVPEGAYANEYQVEVVQGEGVSAETEAEFADGVLAITLGTNSEEEPNATAADVADKVGALDGFSAAATTAGLLEALDEPVQFAGGVDEVKTLDEVEYYVIDGDEKFTDENPATVQLSGSNTRQTASDTILIGTGAAHTALDVVSTDAGEVLEFSTGLPAGSGGIILSSLVTINQNEVFANGAGYYLHLYNAAPTAIADNAAYTLAAADLAKYIGKITISTLVDLGDNCAAHDTGHNMDFELAAADTKLYGILVCIGGETTIDAKTITINLGIAAL